MPDSGVRWVRREERIQGSWGTVRRLMSPLHCGNSGLHGITGLLGGGYWGTALRVVGEAAGICNSEVKGIAPGWLRQIERRSRTWEARVAQTTPTRAPTSHRKPLGSMVGTSSFPWKGASQDAKGKKGQEGKTRGRGEKEQNKEESVFTLSTKFILLTV